MARIRTLALATSGVLLLTFACQARAGESIQVALKSGRGFSGRVHKQSNDKLLWLESGSRSAHMVRPIRWDRIAAAKVGSSKLTTEQLRGRIKWLKSVKAAAAAPTARTQDGRTDAERALEALGFQSRP